MERVALIGGGIIGSSWALVFARAGWQVRVFARHEATRRNLKSRIAIMAQAAAPIAPEICIDDILDRIELADSLATAVAQASWVHESLEENRDEKLRVFAELDASAPPHAVLASSTSSIGASHFAAGLAGRHRILVAHPAAPPHLIPVVEIVPAPFTAPAVVARAFAVMHSLKQAPVLVKSEQPGFVMNRLQGALLTEMFRVIEAGIMSPADVDTLIRDGFGLRWAFLGPLAGIDLNAPGGIGDYLARYGFIFDQLALERGGVSPVVTPALVEALDTAMRAQTPLEALPSKIAWRDARMAALRALRIELEMRDKLGE